MDTNSSSPRKFPLAALLRLYSTGRRTLYLNYFAEFKLLVDWLGPIDTTDYHGDLVKMIPWYCRNYEISEISKLLECNEALIVGTLRRIENDYRST